MNEIVLFGPTKQDHSISMKIYANRLYESLIKNHDYNFSLETVNDVELPILKNWLSKDLYYPIKAGLIKTK